MRSRAAATLANGLPRRGRQFSTSRRLNADFTHAVIGAGVVGLAVARQLAGRQGASTILLERHGAVGTETSSRNSEVIHAGLYYGTDTLKTTLCLKGRELLYSLCQKHNIPHRRTGKWILAQNEQQWDECLKLHSHAKNIGVPTRFVSSEEAARREPDVQALGGIVESPTTGIVDSHALMTYLHGDFEDRGGDCIVQTAVTDIQPVNGGKGGYRIYTGSGGASEASITTETVINCAGLEACRKTPENLLCEGDIFLLLSIGPETEYTPISSAKPRAGRTGNAFNVRHGGTCTLWAGCGMG
ncbi:conserved hypothetical protein [Uncinocarpus reesii 1704]|uniref:L-2-hydroxyglutarate dehydrogenase, mitochondrial n=1 Tax=Uncinocarpus reesii (strain UAMH 1704) TaxID=336963 RepID=C4JVG3_UNCRE|nr:uncharacterized protein UREG_06555 [Uncinocarpus reesii 1704]EEP81690.1 conserved hypothetical protein [Uncinocarpus reesii 1704]